MFICRALSCHVELALTVWSCAAHHIRNMLCDYAECRYIANCLYHIWTARVYYFTALLELYTISVSHVCMIVVFATSPFHGSSVILFHLTIYSTNGATMLMFWVLLYMLHTSFLCHGIRSLRNYWITRILRVTTIKLHVCSTTMIPCHRAATPFYNRATIP